MRISAIACFSTFALVTIILGADQTTSRATAGAATITATPRASEAQSQPAGAMTDRGDKDSSSKNMIRLAYPYMREVRCYCAGARWAGMCSSAHSDNSCCTAICNGQIDRHHYYIRQLSPSAPVLSPSSPPPVSPSWPSKLPSSWQDQQSPSRNIAK